MHQGIRAGIYVDFLVGYSVRVLIESIVSSEVRKLRLSYPYFLFSCACSKIGSIHDNFMSHFRYRLQRNGLKH